MGPLRPAQTRGRSLVKAVVFAQPFSRFASKQLLPGHALSATVCGFSGGPGTGLKVASRRSAVCRASDGGRTCEVPKKLVLIGHSPGTKHSADLARGGVGAYSKAPPALPLLVKSFEF